MTETTIRYICFPRTKPPPHFSSPIADVFKKFESDISTLSLEKGLTSDEVLQILRPNLTELGFEVEKGKRKGQ